MVKEGRIQGVPELTPNFHVKNYNKFNFCPISKLMVPKSSEKKVVFKIYIQQNLEGVKGCQNEQ